MNKEKTLLFFNKNIGRDTHEEIKNIFGAQIIHKHERYLGLPILVGRGKGRLLTELRTKLGERL